MRRGATTSSAAVGLAADANTVGYPVLVLPSDILSFCAWATARADLSLSRACHHSNPISVHFRHITATPSACTSGDTGEVAASRKRHTGGDGGDWFRRGHLSVPVRVASPQPSPRPERTSHSRSSRSCIREAGCCLWGMSRVCLPQGEAGCYLWGVSRVCLSASHLLAASSDARLARVCVVNRSPHASSRTLANVDMRVRTLWFPPTRAPTE